MIFIIRSSLVCKIVGMRRSGQSAGRRKRESRSMRRSILNGRQIMNFEFRIERMEAAHFHQSIEILYVLEGNPEICIQDRICQAHPEDVIVINANKKHSYQSGDDVLIGCFEIDFWMLADMLGTNQLFFWCNSALNRNAAYDDMRRVMKQIFSLYFEKAPYGKVILEGLYYQLLRTLLENFMVQSNDRRFEGEKAQDEDRIAAIINYIHSNYKKKLRLSELSEIFYLSVPYLSKYIKNKMGMNFIDYVNSIRLFHAVDDMLYTDGSVTAIALENGFASAAAFTELFRRSYGMTPSEYRQQMKTASSEAEGAEGGGKGRKKLLEKRVSEYLDSQLVQTPPEVSCGDDYIVLNTRDRVEYVPYWKKMLNAGRMEDLLRSDMREQVLMFRNDLGFTYLRIWDIFSGNMLLNETSGTGDYHFDKIDSVFDFLTEHGIRPYLELGYKPEELHSTLGSVIYKKQREIPFRSMRSFRTFFNAFVAHLINRYGLEEVETWYFEQWSGEDFDRASYDGHFWEVFECIYDVVKKHSPEIRVGGGGIGIQYGSVNLERLVRDWGEKRCRPDFLSLYCYPYIRGDEDGTAYARQSADRDFLKNQLEMAESIIADSPLKDAEIHVTEWSSTISNRNILNDSCYKGAYILKNIIDCFGRVGVLGYWTGSDIFAEHLDTNRLLFGGCGLVSASGIKKPAFYAYRFLNYQGKYLLFRGKNSIVTTNGNNNYSVACHNYRHLNYRYYLKQENELKMETAYQLFEDSQPLQLNYQLTNVKNGKYKIKTYSISSESGSIQEELHKIGDAGSLSRAETGYLERICTPRIQIRTCQVTQNVLNFETKLQAQEIQYIHISYLYE